MLALGRQDPRITVLCDLSELKSLDAGPESLPDDVFGDSFSIACVGDLIQPANIEYRSVVWGVPCDKVEGFNPLKRSVL